MGFVGYQEDTPSNAVINKSASTMGQMTNPDFSTGLSLQGDTSIADALLNPANQGTLNQSFQDNGSIKLFNSNRSFENRAKSMAGLNIQKDAGWDPKEAIKGLGPAYEQYYTDLLNTQNQADFQLLVKDIDNQHNRSQVLSSAGGSPVAAFTGMAIDPVNFIPLAGPAKLGEISMLGKTARASANMSVAERTAAIGSNVTALDRDLAIRTMWGEARNQGSDGMAAVANVILNRVERGTYGKDIQDIVTSRHQFEPWGNPKTRAQMQALDPSSNEYQKIGELFDGVATGKISDNTGGADMFFAPKAQAALGRDTPSWASGTPTATVGEHVFYASDANAAKQGRKIAVNAAAQTFLGSEVASGMEVFGQYMSNPDYSGKDALTTMGMGTMLGLGGGAFAYTVGELRAAKLSMGQSEFTGFMRDKMRSLKGFGTDPDLKGFASVIDAIKTAGEPLAKWTGRVADVEDELGVQPKSIGAAAYKSSDPVSIYKVGNVAKFLRYTNPILDTLSGASNDAKRIMSNLYEHNILTNSDIKGEPLAPGGAVATRIRVQMGRLADFQKDLDDSYRAFQKERINQKIDPMSRSEFEREVWRGTWNASTMSDNAFIAKSVDAFRKKVGQPFLDDAKSVGLIKTGAGPDYSPVIYSRPAIRNDTTGFKEKVKQATIEGYNNFVAQNPGKKGAFQFDPNVNKADLERFAQDYTHYWAEDTEQTLADMADAATGRIKSRVSMPLQYNVLEDYMENQIGEVASRYARSMSPDIELTRSFGSLDLANEKQAVKNEYDALIAKKPSDAAALTKERDRMIDNIDWSVKNIRNRDDYSMMTSQGMRTAIKALNLWTFTRAMGKFVVNSVAESGMPLLVHGYSKTYGTIMKDYHSGFANLKLARDQARVAGIAVDKALAERMTALLDGAHTATDQGNLERNIDKLMGGAAKLFGMPMVNDTFRSMSTLWHNKMFGEDIPKLANFGKGTVDKNLMIKYANLGIGQDEARMIAQEMDKHGEWVDGDFFTPNTQQWDPDVARIYNSSLMKGVDNEFLIPQAGDMPKVAQTAWGKPLFFLRSYTFTATNRLALAGMQRANPEMAKGVAGLMALGMLSNALYQAANGRPQPEGMNVVYGALDRAGVLGLFWEANKLSDSITGVWLGNGDKQKSYSNPIEQIGGSNAYTIGDTVDFMSHPSLDRAFKLLPGSNWLPMEAAKRSLIQ